MDVEAGTTKVTNLVWLLRLLVVLHAAVALAQAVFAGWYLEGRESALNLHQLTGTSVITTVSVLQVVVAAVCWRRHQHSGWFALGSFLLFGVEMIQIGLGFTGQLALHLPVGVIIFGGAMVLLYASFKHYEPRGSRDEEAAGKPEPEPRAPSVPVEEPDPFLDEPEKG